MNTESSPNFKYIAALGSTTMNKFSSLKIFLFGLRGTGSEVAKNLMLAMPKQLTIQDDEKVKASDLASNPFLSPADIGTKIRSDAVFNGLKALNPNVDLQIHKGDVSLDKLSQFNLVIFTDTFSNLDKLFDINDFCRSQKEPIGFIYTGCLGLFSYLFVDFGDHFKVYDKDGEAPKWYVIDNITKGEPGVVTVDHSKPHTLNTGDFVRFSDIEGMTELNGPECRPVRVTSTFAFSVEDTSEFNEYKRGGRAEEVKVPFSISFKSLRDSMTNFLDEEFLQEWSDYRLLTATRFFNLKVALYTLCMFSHMQQGGIKASQDPAVEEARIKQIVDSAKNMLDELKPDVKFDERIVKQCIQFSQYQLAPLCSFIGGLVAIEAIKFAGKYTPFKGFFFYDCLACLPDEETPVQIPKELVGTRYEDIVAIFGPDAFEAFRNKRLLLIGGGSTASEYIKNIALLGISSGQKGKIQILDEAKVSKFDFNSYFPLKNEDLGKEKAKLAVEEAKKLNEEVNCEYIIGKAEEQSSVTEKESLWEGIDAIISALDYRLSKAYLNQKSVWYEKPMLSTAVHGLKGTLQLNIPFITEDFRDISELKPERFESNIVWSFPYLFDHVIQWATELFKLIFKKISQMAKEIIVDKAGFIEAQGRKSKVSSHSILKLKIVQYLLFEGKELKYEDLLALSRDLHKYFFSYCVNKLITEFPQTARDSDGRKIWKGYYRFPSEFALDIADEYSRAFIVSGANIFAKMLKMKPQELDVAKIVNSAQQTVDFKIHNKEEDLRNLLNMLKINQVNLKENNITEIDMYEDEEDRPLYADFVASAAYIKARCYDILSFYPKKFSESKYKVEKVAFNMKLNIPTTNSIIAGLQVIELLKLFQNKTPDSQKNFYLNLGINKVVAAPLNYVTKKTLEPNYQEYSVWTKLEFGSDMTIEKILELFAVNYGKTLTKISYKKTILYDEKQENKKDSLTMTPKEILVNGGLENELSDKKSIALTYDIGEKELKYFLPRLKYKLSE